MHSCFYEGQVRHRRFSPKQHEFNYRLFYVYLDLDETDTVFANRWFWSCNKPALAWCKRADYLGDSDTPLKQSVYDLVEKETGKRPDGPVRLLTHLRYFGYVFNPVSFYYCFDNTDSHVETIVAEITNTPWGETHTYVLPQDKNMLHKQHMQFSMDKIFHVSPFMPMDIHYDWRFTEPANALNVHMSNTSSGNKVFDATLTLKQRDISSINCARALTVFPLLTLKIITSIYWQALILFIKRTPFYTHPDKLKPTSNGGA